MINQRNAIKRVELAIKRGDLARPNRCEICGDEPPEHHNHSIVAHHWAGYDNPLKVWFVCRSCNGFLDIHDGSLNIEQARVYIRRRQVEKFWRKLGYYLSDNDPRWRII